MKLTGYTISEFASLISSSESITTNNTLYGTVVYVDEKLYVNIDGSSSLTPATTESEVKEGERVSVSIQNHSAVIRGNSDNPSASTGTVTDNYNEFVDTTEDINNQLASLNINNDSIIARVEDVEGSVSTLELRADEFDVTVSAKADSGNIISTINASREGIKISSEKVNITGMVTFEDLSGEGKSIINGSNIQGGIISAAEEINFIGGARIFGNAGGFGAGLTVSASQYSFSGASQSFMYGNWDISGKLAVSGASSFANISASRVDASAVASSGGVSGANGYFTGGVQCNTLSCDDTAWIGSAYISGSWVTSDRRLKTDIRYVDDDAQSIGESGWMSPNVNIHKSDMLEFIETLPIVSYRYKSDVINEEDVTHYGIITQDVLYTKVGSELVKVMYTNGRISDEDGYMGYSPEKLMIFMCGALQEEIKARKALEDRVNKLGE